VVKPTLDGCKGKLGRAKTHLYALEDEIARAESLDNHEITVEDEPETAEYVFKVVGLQRSDPAWGLLAGDCIHNLRSALDHLVYQLALLGQARALTDGEARSTSFPVFDDRDRFRESGQGRLKLLRMGEQTRIAELQPFNAWDASIWGGTPVGVTDERYRFGPAGVPGALDHLAALDNTDKHRLVNATWRVARWWEWPGPPIGLRGSFSSNALEDGAEIGRWGYTEPRPELPTDMDMDSYFPLGVGLGEPPFMYSAVDTLAGLADAVEIVLKVFRPCLDSGDPPMPLAGLG